VTSGSDFEDRPEAYQAATSSVLAANHVRSLRAALRARHGVYAARIIGIVDEAVAVVVEGIGALGDYRVMVLPDHATPVSTKTHAPDPVPFLIFDSRGGSGSGRPYSEREAAATGDMVGEGYELITQFLIRS